MYILNCFLELYSFVPCLRYNYFTKYYSFCEQQNGNIVDISRPNALKTHVMSYVECNVLTYYIIYAMKTNNTLQSTNKKQNYTFVCVYLDK